MGKTCLVLNEGTLKQNAALLNRWRNCIELAELRADCLESADADSLRRFILDAGVPVIMSLGKAADNGHFRGTAEERRKLLCSAADSAAYVELEFNEPDDECYRIVNNSSAVIIRSLSFQKSFPDNLEELVRSVPGNEIPKVQVYPGSGEDLLRLLLLARELKDRKKLFVGLGEKGTPIQLFPDLFGSLFSYCSPGSDAADPRILRDVYNRSTLNEKTRLFGIIGNPVLHTKSPHIHNPAYRRDSMDAVYIPFPSESVEGILPFIKEVPVEGFSVTLPFKQEIIPYLDTIGDEVTAIGSCNTVRIRNGRFEGINTDVGGFLRPLLNIIGSLKKKRVTVIGAGGSSRAVVYGCVREGAEVVVLNRTVAKAEALAAEFYCLWGGLNSAGYDLAYGHNDVIIQTTSAGMAPNDDINPFEEYTFIGTEIVYDIVYHPPKTKLMKQAEKAGCRVLNGEQMLLEQAKLQYRYFTGNPFPEIDRLADAVFHGRE